ncbi:hypothetical protein VTP01DRAFT_10461 [Rhizomucor pusillus]|uniref:uncharacterized protein n=1 Tax=Rhizomucor pusillus TaxID=4840 RepID=UPI0037420B61
MAEESEVPTSTGEEQQTTTTKTVHKPLRVKLYRLDNDGVWIDQGTGSCVYSTGEEDELYVRSEKDQEPLLVSKVQKRKVYQRQQDTLIVWTEDTNLDVALSFQEASGCEEIWRLICQKGDSEMPLDPASERSEGTPPVARHNEDDKPLLPTPELSNLSEILKLLDNVTTIQAKDVFASFIVLENYIDKLVPIFESCEDLESLDDLYKLYKIMKSIITLNDNTIVEYIVRDEIVYSVAGIMEYNPETPGQKAKYREVLTAIANMKPVVPLNDEVTLSKIHHTLRLRFFRDVILSDVRDENFAATMNSLIYFSNMDIIGSIQENRKFCSELFSIITKEDATKEMKDEALKFVMQLCQMANIVQVSTRLNMYRTLGNLGMFDVLLYGLRIKEKRYRETCLKILLDVAEHDASLLRTQMVRNCHEKGNAKDTLLATIVAEFLQGPDSNLINPYAELLKVLLGLNLTPATGAMLAPEAANRQDADLDDFLQIFYDNYMTMLMQPIEQLETKPIQLSGPIEVLQLSRDENERLYHVLETISSAIRLHTFRSKYLILSTDCLPKILQVFRCPESHLKLAGLRVFRACVGMADEFYNRNLIKHNTFEPIIRQLLDTNGKYNLLNSACLEMLEFIRRENLKSLINHLINTFGTVLDTITYVPTIKNLRLKYEQINEERVEDSSSSSEKSKSPELRRRGGQGGWHSSTVDREEESYFSSDDNASEADSSNEDGGTSKPLVDYADEEEEEEEQNDNAMETDADNEKDIAAGPSSPPRPPKRKLEVEDEDEDNGDQLALQAGGLRKKPCKLGAQKRIVIKPQKKS